MRIDLVYPTLPPEIGGIADHTILLATALADAGYAVRILTRAAPTPPAPLPPSVQIVPIWPATGPTSVLPLLRRLRHDAPDAVVVQFEQFSYGQRGVNPGFALLFVLMRLLRVRARRMLYAHETYTTPDRVRWIPMWLVQLTQFAVLVRSADVVCVAAEQWLGRVRRLGRDAVLVPIFANIDVADDATPGNDPPLTFDQDSTVVVWFGYLDDRRESYFEACLTAVAQRPGTELVYVGKDYEAAERIASRRGLPIRAVGNAAPQTISRLLRAADICAAPFPDGVSSRRGSFLAELSHGARVVTTVGPATEPALLAAHERDVFAASSDSSPARFAGVLAEELERTVRRTSRSLPVAPDVTAFYKAAYSPEHAAAQLAELLQAPVSR